MTYILPNHVVSSQSSSFLTNWYPLICLSTYCLLFDIYFHLVSGKSYLSDFSPISGYSSKFLAGFSLSGHSLYNWGSSGFSLEYSFSLLSLYPLPLRSYPVHTCLYYINKIICWPVRSFPLNSTLISLIVYSTSLSRYLYCL